MYSLVGLLLVLFLCCASGYVVDLDENTQAQIAEVVRVYVKSCLYSICYLCSTPMQLPLNAQMSDNECLCI